MFNDDKLKKKRKRSLDAYSDYIPTLAPTSAERIMSSIADSMETAPQLGNTLTAADGLCTAGRCVVSFCYATNTVSRVCFATGCVCGIVGSGLSGAAAASTYCGYSVGGFAGAVGARACNRVGKYAMTVGKVTNGDVAAVMEWNYCKYFHATFFSKEGCI